MTRLLRHCCSQGTPRPGLRGLQTHKGPGRQGHRGQSPGLGTLGWAVRAEVGVRSRSSTLMTKMFGEWEFDLEHYDHEEIIIRYGQSSIC